MKTFRALLVFVVLLVLVGLGILYSGVYDVSATKPDSKAVAWILETASEHSIERHSRGIAAPKLDDPALLRTGIVHYQEMCVTCHGGPGDIPASEIGQGLNPTPPMLGEAAGDPPAELFWVVKNGIKMTGMPGFAHIKVPDQEIWAIAAFLKKLPTVSPADYKAWTAGPVVKPAQ